MKISKLIKLCLQYLEQDGENNVDNSDMVDLENNDTFKEYVINIEHVLYSGLSRFATEGILPLKELIVPEGINTLHLVEEGTNKRIYTEIKDVYALDENNNIMNNVKYALIGDKLLIQNKNEKYKYFVIYTPTINSLETYLKPGIDTIYEIELTDIGNNHICVPDQMAINLKYLVYSEMKLEENPSVANVNKNYFETYLSATKAEQVQRSQVQVEFSGWNDNYGDKDWSVENGS